MKHCTTCSQSLPLTDFYTCTRAATGKTEVSYLCKTCTKARHHAEYHDVELKAQRKATKLASRKSALRKPRARKIEKVPMKWCKQCSIKLPLVAFREIEYASGRKRRLNQCKPCFAAHTWTKEDEAQFKADLAAAKGKPLVRPARTEEQRKACIESVKRWRLANRDKYNALDSMYKRKSRNPHYLAQWPLIVAHYGGRCLRCKSKELASDHVVPLVPGGGALNCLANLQPLCRACNSGKSGLAFDYRPDQGAWILENIPDATEPFGRERIFRTPAHQRPVNPNN